MPLRPVTVRDAMLFFEKAPVAIMVVDSAARAVVAFNENAVRRLGYPQPGMSLGKLLPPAQLRRFFETLSHRDETVEIENSQVTLASGTVRDVDFSLRRLAGSNLVVIAIQDFSGRADREEQLRQSQKMEALGMLAGGIAHDFNNLLTIISGYSQMLQSNRLNGDLDREALHEVLKACEHAAGLTAQLLAFSRRQALQPQTIDINRLLDETVVLLRRLIGEQIELQIRPDPDAGFIHADPGQIRQVILNLAINARDAMPEGGSLLIQTRRAGSAGARPVSWTTLEFTDTGRGMDEKTRRRLFEPFFTTKPPGKGTGIGLATVQRIVKHAGGTIQVASEPGRGTSFRVSLPRIENPAIEEGPATREVPDPLGGHETILLAEDDDGVRTLTTQVLERRGYRVIAAHNGAEALQAERACEGPIALLIADMVMPGISGGTLADRVRERRPGITVIFISGYPGDATFTGDSFLRKPFTPGELAAKVRELLDRGENGGRVGSIAAGQ